jgi:hypothetical protein
LRVWLPSGGASGEIDFAEVEAAIESAHALYGLTYIACESPMAQASVQRLQARNIPIEAVAPSPQTQRAICDALLTAFHEQAIDLYPHPALLADLRAMTAVESQTGVKLKPAKNAKGDATPHGDAAMAFAFAVWAARRGEAIRAVVAASSGRELVCWP